MGEIRLLIMKKQYLITAISILALIVSLFFDQEILSFFIKFKFGPLTPFLLILNHWITNVILFLIMPTIIFIKKRKKLGFFYLSLIMSYLFVTILKILVARERPDLAFLPEETFSFPSRHAAIAFAVIPFMLKEKGLVFWWIAGILIGLSRLLLGAHYLSDVLGGALIGYYTSYFIFIWYKKH